MTSSGPVLALLRDNGDSPEPHELVIRNVESRVEYRVRGEVPFKVLALTPFRGRLLLVTQRHDTAIVARFVAVPEQVE